MALSPLIHSPSSPDTAGAWWLCFSGLMFLVRLLQVTVHPQVISEPDPPEWVSPLSSPAKGTLAGPQSSAGEVALRHGQRGSD